MLATSTVSGNVDEPSVARIMHTREEDTAVSKHRRIIGYKDINGDGLIALREKFSGEHEPKHRRSDGAEGMDPGRAIDAVARMYLPGYEAEAPLVEWQGREFKCPHCGYVGDSCVMTYLSVECERYSPDFGFDKSYDTNTLASVTTCYECEKPIDLDER